MKISGAIFDMDGTLTDSMYVWENMGEKYARFLGFELPAEHTEDTKDMSIRQVLAFLAREFGINKTEKEIRADINAIVEPGYRTEVLPKSGAIQMLEELKSRGVKMCVATATDLHLAEMVLTRLDIRKFFSKVFTTTLVGENKNSPLIYELALEHLGTPKAETPVFEDALYAAKTAKAAGFPLVGVYDLSADNDRPELEALADVFISDYIKDFKL